MFGKCKIDSTEKVVERILANEISVIEEARLIGVDVANIRCWRNQYILDGPTAYQQGLLSGVKTAGRS